MLILCKKFYNSVQLRRIRRTELCSDLFYAVLALSNGPAKFQCSITTRTETVVAPVVVCAALNRSHYFTRETDFMMVIFFSLSAVYRIIVQYKAYTKAIYCFRYAIDLSRGHRYKHVLTRLNVA